MEITLCRNGFGVFFRRSRILPGAWNTGLVLLLKRNLRSMVKRQPDNGFLFIAGPVFLTAWHKRMAF